MKYTQIVYEVKPQTFHFVGRSGPWETQKSDLSTLLWAKGNWDFCGQWMRANGYPFEIAMPNLKFS